MHNPNIHIAYRRRSPQPARDPDAPPAALPIAVAIDDVADVVLREEVSFRQLWDINRQSNGAIKCP